MQMKENALVLNTETTSVFQELKNSLETCQGFYFNVAFINYGGLQLFVRLLEELQQKGIKGKIITSTYLNFTDPKALRKLTSFKNVDVKVYHDVKQKGFHSKAYLFEYEEFYKVIIGSSNITASALKSNIEWNVKVISKKDDDFMMSVMDEFTQMWNQVELVDDAFINAYEQFIKTINAPKLQYYYENDRNIIKPNSLQQRAVENLEKLRQYHEHKALVIAATGTGKTYLSAFDVKQCKPNKVLFIVHREDILIKAEQSFKRVLGATIQTGFYTGKHKDDHVKYLFATIQTMHRYYDMFDQDEFDYIIIDEAHHAGSDTYQKVLHYFKPNFLLGMSATPERSDNMNIYEVFDHNVAIEVRLHQAMDEELVVPFHYFGITDIDAVHLENVSLKNVDEVAKALKLNQRVDFIIDQMKLYGYDGEHRKCLGFCVSIDHAKFMSDEFNRRGICSIYLDGSDAIEKREAYCRRLEDDKDPLEVIFTVDIFNEGIDIPSVNLVLMLRPTNSPIIFVQQLGRGLRKFENKEYLTVLDFIGNHNRAFLIAIALKGSRYYDKDSLKVAVQNEFMNIPGNTYVQLDRISKKRILAQLENENFLSLKYLKEEYFAFKALRCGEPILYLMDYLKYDGATNPIKFIQYSSTYLNFVATVEKEERLQQLADDETFIKYLRYLSNFLPLRRPFEFRIIKELMKSNTLTVEECHQYLLKDCKEVSMDSCLHAIETLNFDYYDSSQKRIYRPLLSMVGNHVSLSREFEFQLQDKLKKEYLLDTLRYGLNCYQDDFMDENYGMPFFKKYAQYTMQEVALCSNYRKIHSAFRGSGLLTKENDYFLFIDLHKEKSIKESINYQDKFINRKYFQWQTPNSTAPDSLRGKNIIDNKKREIKLHLFIRKFKQIDHKIQPYIYIGTGNSVEHHGSKPITVKILLDDILPAKLYEELTCRVDVEKE